MASAGLRIAGLRDLGGGANGPQPRETDVRGWWGAAGVARLDPLSRTLSSRTIGSDCVHCCRGDAASAQRFSRRSGQYQHAETPEPRRVDTAGAAAIRNHTCNRV